MALDLSRHLVGDRLGVVDEMDGARSAGLLVCTRAYRE
jgi:hypothetical protein